MNLEMGRCFNTECCLSGHHRLCNQHDIEQRQNIPGHNFITLASDKHTVLAVALTSRESGHATSHGCLYSLEPDDIKVGGRLAGRSMVRYDCVCKISKKHITRIESTVIANVGIKKILEKFKDFVLSP